MTRLLVLALILATAMAFGQQDDKVAGLGTTSPDEQLLKKSADARQAERPQEMTLKLLRENAIKNMEGEAPEDAIFTLNAQQPAVWLLDRSHSISKLSLPELRELYKRYERIRRQITDQPGIEAEIEVRIADPDESSPELSATDPHTKELREAVRKSFELRIKMQSAELDQAEAQLRSARERLKWRHQNADMLIEKRIRKLTGTP